MLRTVQCHISQNTKKKPPDDEKKKKIKKQKKKKKNKKKLPRVERSAINVRRIKNFFISMTGTRRLKKKKTTTTLSER